jgi:chorismate mutase
VEQDLIRLREEIAALDGALIELLARRFALAEAVGRMKARRAEPIVAREVEQHVRTRARQAAETCRVSPDVMEDVFAAIIRASVERQHRVGIELHARPGARLLVLGAAGGMGGWFRRFLTSIGHEVEGVDPAWGALPPAAGCYRGLDVVPDLAAYRAVLVAVPLAVMPEALLDLAGRGLSGRRWSRSPRSRATCGTRMARCRRPASRS